nr:MAG TPA: hypothetical protein [Caudoviricetes sp.]
MTLGGRHGSMAMSGYAPDGRRPFFQVRGVPPRHWTISQ